MVDNNQVMVVESLHLLDMVKNHKLAKAISDVGLGMFVNFVAYNLEKEGKVLVEIDRCFPTSKLCCNCHDQVDEMPLDVREWTCSSCGTRHDRDGNAAINIRAEGMRMLLVSGTGTATHGKEVRPMRGRKSEVKALPCEVRSLCYTRSGLASGTSPFSTPNFI
ncbi:MULTISPECIES: RNA-guided endonuclease TnpB family protein [Okeania]|uniref:RNA-guided endonuclease InsQ/TnpB family protein n=1 Tax=Okeania TaxID=1458928 RepID=UPI003084385C